MLVLVANLLRDYLEKFSRHANAGQIKEATDLIRHISKTIDKATKQEGD